MFFDLVVGQMVPQCLHDPFVVGSGVELQVVDVLQDQAKFSRAVGDQLLDCLTSHVVRLGWESTLLVVANLWGKLWEKLEIFQSL